MKAKKSESSARTEDIEKTTHVPGMTTHSWQEVEIVAGTAGDSITISMKNSKKVKLSYTRMKSAIKSFTLSSQEKSHYSNRSIQFKGCNRSNGEVDVDEKWISKILMKMWSMSKESFKKLVKKIISEI